jgi:hypothetical protein
MGRTLPWTGLVFQHLDFFSVCDDSVGQVENLRAGWQPALSDAPN